jgi:hypothetical protein
VADRVADGLLADADGALVIIVAGDTGIVFAVFPGIACFHAVIDSVAADRMLTGEAALIRTVSVLRVPVIALFTETRLENAIPAVLRLTVAAASILTESISIVTLFAGLHLAIAAVVHRHAPLIADNAAGRGG